MESRIRRVGPVLLLAVLVLVAVARPARAQSRWSAGLAYGPVKVTGGTYRDRDRTEVAGRIGYRLGAMAGTDVELGALVEDYFGNKTYGTVAVPCAWPGCTSFPTVATGVPDYAYEAATLALRRHLDGATLGLDAGLGSVQVQDVGRRLGVSGGADLGIHVGGPVSLVLRGEILSWTEGGNTLYAYPITIGLRVN